MKLRKTFLLLPLFALTCPGTVSADRIISGRIVDLGGQGLPKVKVVAYDHDFNDLITGNSLAIGDCDAALFHIPCPGDAHDEMGEDITDANGNYRIEYDPPNRFPGFPGHWDASFSQNDTRWRPDIFIEVYISTDGFCEGVPTGSYNWRFAGRSQIIIDQQTDTDLTLNYLVLERFDLSCGPFVPLAPYMAGPPGELRGWVDLHAHPMAHLAFGGNLLHGTPDVGVLMPGGTRSCDIKALTRASGFEDVLGHCGPTHMFPIPIDRECGDVQRYASVSVFEAANTARWSHGAGFPTFQGWAPVWNDLTHQKMWIDWIYRAYRGGQRVMVALAVNSRTQALLTKGALANHYLDKASGDLQIDEMKRMVSRHSFMEIAYTPEQLRDIVRRNKLAIVLGVELDDFGDFQYHAASHTNIRAEIERLHTLGVRYVFPVHLTDNRLGATAVYKEVINVANMIQTGSFWSLTCEENIGFHFEVLPTYTNIVTTLDFVLNSLPFNLGSLFREPALGSLSAAQRANPKLVLEAYLQHLLQINTPLPDGQTCANGWGHVNSNRLTTWGVTAINQLMALGMMIDIDHMSRRTLDDVIALTSTSDYPLNSGHNGLKSADAPLSDRSENDRTLEQYTMIAARGGMAGVGTAKHAREFMEVYANTVEAMQEGNPVKQSPGLGTDINGMQQPPHPPSLAVPRTPDLNYVDFPRARTGQMEWDYNIHGVGHYGMLPDYLVHVGQRPGGTTVLSNLFGSAEAFARMWEKCRTRSEVWVDGQWSGLENGSRFYPFNTLAEGLSACQPGNVLWLRPGAYTYGTSPALIKQSVTVRASGGDVLINNRIRIKPGSYIILNSEGGIRTAGN